MKGSEGVKLTVRESVTACMGNYRLVAPACEEERRCGKLRLRVHVCVKSRVCVCVCVRSRVCL